MAAPFDSGALRAHIRVEGTDGVVLVNNAVVYDVEMGTFVGMVLTVRDCHGGPYIDQIQQSADGPTFYRCQVCERIIFLRVDLMRSGSRAAAALPQLDSL